MAEFRCRVVSRSDGGDGSKRSREMIAAGKVWLSVVQSEDGRYRSRGNAWWSAVGSHQCWKNHCNSEMYE